MKDTYQNTSPRGGREGASYQNYLDRLNIQNILSYAGYKLNRRDGLKYPCFVKIGDDGRRVRGDKFVITQGGKCCFRPPAQKSYNIISLIKNFPEMFPEYSSGINSDRLVNTICRRILNMPDEQRLPEEVRNARAESKPFALSDYDIVRFNAHDQRNRELFDQFFKHRGIDLMTQNIFRKSFCLATHEKKPSVEGKPTRKLTNLSFPLFLPKDVSKHLPSGKMEGTVGFEQRGRPRLDGKAFKGKAEGSNGSEGLWIASPNNVALGKAKNIYWFESAYDAMAYFQTHIRKDFSLYKSVFVSTGGTPTVYQTQGVLKESPHAEHHICFDNELAGKQFVHNWKSTAGTLPFARDISYRVETPKEGCKDWNDELHDELSTTEAAKKGGTVRTTIVTKQDLDGDGEDDIIEEEQKVEDKKRTIHARHH